jgi:hypothetical protein
MIQRRRGSRFLHESLDPHWILGQIGRQDLDGKVAAERCVSSAINFAHTARPNACDDLISTDA